MTSLLTGSLRRPFLRVARPLLALLSLAAMAGTAAAQDLGDGIDEILSWVTPSTPGCAVAVAHEGERIVYAAYGSADLEHDVPLTPDTVFDVGSVVKQFVAAAVLLLVEDGRCSLGDDVREHIPELFDYGHVVTIDHLLTHTSGLRDWLGLRNLSSEDDDALTMILRQRGLNFVPGEEWSYSNSNYVLLKELVARLSETSFSDFAQSRIFEPLEMQATTYATGPLEGHERLAVGYEKRGPLWQKDVLVGNERGGGGALLSTVGDLLIWNEALAGDRLGAFVSAKLDEPARLSSGRQLGYSRGLFLERVPGRRVIWHTGSAGGYKAMLSRYPDQGLSIAILSNAGESSNRSELTRLIVDRLAPASDSRDAAPEASSAVTDLASKAGLYFSERTGDPLRLVAQGGELRIVAGPALVPVAEGRFRNAAPQLVFMSEDEFELRFLSEDEIELESMEGRITAYHRAQPDWSTAEDRQALAGRYESDELPAALEAAAEGTGLLVRINESRQFTFTAAGRDTFQYGPILLRFHRDEDEEVVGLDLSNPVLRRVPFARVDDGPGGG